MLGSRMRLASSLAMLTVAVAITSLSADDQPQQAAQPANQPPAAQYRVKSLLGSQVHIEGEVSIGTVDDVVFDDNGVVEYLIVLNQGKMVTVPWEAAKFNFEKRTAMINITPEKFRRIPTYTVEQYPTFSTPAYRTQTYDYYGMRPAQVRRLERRLP